MASEGKIASVTVSNLTFNGGATVSVAERDIVVIVGPNNAGKSAVLRAIHGKFSDESFRSPVIESITMLRTGEPEDLLGWLESSTFTTTTADPQVRSFQGWGQEVAWSNAKHYWTHSVGLYQLTRFFCHMLTADERLQICQPPASISLSQQSPIHPFHFLQRDDTLERHLSNKFRKAFGVDLIVHRNAGNNVPVHVGERPIVGAGEDRISLEYIKKIEALPTLHSQGDGMRSFAGVLLATSVGRESVMLIDEPEAFLHPPQARLLGNTLVQDQPHSRQMFIATHSTDVLRGILDTNNSNVRVIRIRREGKFNPVRVLDNRKIKELWSDPLLRYSNIFDGLFHEAVIVCESDSDCRFYSAVLDAIFELQGPDARRPDVMFTHCGGKHRLALVARALKEVEVPVKIVADFDVLSEEEPLRSIVEALQLDWSALRADWNLVKTAIGSKKPDLIADDVKSDIGKVLENVSQRVFPPEAKQSIQDILRRSSTWAHAKTVGKAFVPAGDPAQACERLLDALRKGGLHVVEVGELEGFVRTEGGHGPRWVNSVIGRPLGTDPELDQARRFVARLIT